ncbi:nitrilase-related carbon-nitrogen hydrolase [Nitrospirillum sp. BR 11828]|uniref:nitrilase-related carbon-nitrogen hydrolase n=1 Tax=Nitrospirillum sp. BR 11828 TaxID=3104325 RepID=UPI002ACA5499|nr:nitrilase-related carbon-nitrogen hydrolase [Nitrospirillum sp. BR 11828]MDZ5645872.1 nitrilase-related carbon-nitrogen hydrolase [Nitrospirillum sp. BR 11828]
MPYVMAMCRFAPRRAFAADGCLVREALADNVDRHCALIERAAGDHGAKLVAFPEFALTGHAMLSNDQWVASSLTFPGPEVDRIADAARRAGVYVVIQAAERHAAFPGRYFLSAAILTPGGGIGLVHRKNYAFSLRTSPIDVYDTFIDAFGPDAFLPVLDTPIGGLAVSIGAEVHWPEAIRSLAMKGAEVVLNPIAAAPLIDYLDRPGAAAVRQARAFENVLYLGMTNIAGDGDAPLPQVYDFKGAAIGAPAVTDDVFTLATVDLAALRTWRATPAANLLAQIQPIHDSPYDVAPWPRNTLPSAPAASADQIIGVEAAVWRRMEENLGRARS